MIEKMNSIDMMHETSDKPECNESLDFARLMRGQVPEWGSDYIEKYIPPIILQQLKDKDIWEDEDGFFWGFRYVCATKLEETGENVIILASKYVGQGYSEQKVLLPLENAKESDDVKWKILTIYKS